MAGIYLHIPFCKTRCIYCDFFTQTNRSHQKRFVNAACSELLLRKDYIAGEPVSTIYLGGGTPSLLDKADFDKLFATIYQYFRVDADAEITLEANPDDLSPDYIKLLRSLPFNRISIGIQSLNDGDLTYLCRRHSAQRAMEAVRDCRAAGFTNISIDLMYGLPHQTPETWATTLDKAIELNVQHISAYHLIYEEGTELYRLMQTGTVQEADEELSVQLFDILKNKLEQAGFIHYEISNFAQAACFSRHNSAYWLGNHYLGVGPSAHSYNGLSRSWNVASIEEYVHCIESGSILSEIEILTPSMQYNDFILTGLRTMWGINLDRLTERFGNSMATYCLQQAAKYIASGHIIEKNRQLTITNKGRLISDGIMSDLMSVSR
jgi:oxygen-independent coproporphyrinogen-3 oxidase